MVYFTREVSPEALVKMYDALGVKIPGKVAIKLHSGEKGNPNYLRPKFVKPLIDHVGGTVVECNTAYPGERDTTDKHVKLWQTMVGVNTSTSTSWTLTAKWNWISPTAYRSRRIMSARI